MQVCDPGGQSTERRRNGIELDLFDSLLVDRRVIGGMNQII